MKKSAKWILGLAVLALLTVGGSYLGNYYNARYVGEDYYTKVPDNFDMSLEDIKDNEGKVQDKGKEYKLIGYNNNLDERLLEFSKVTEDVSKLYQPGTYLKVTASSQIVLSEEVVSESQVPSEILKKIN